MIHQILSHNMKRQQLYITPTKCSSQMYLYDEAILSKTIYPRLSKKNLWHTCANRVARCQLQDAWRHKIWIECGHGKHRARNIWQRFRCAVNNSWENALEIALAGVEWNFKTVDVDVLFRIKLKSSKSRGNKWLRPLALMVSKTANHLFVRFVAQI